jgi:hypothetical protein
MDQKCGQATAQTGHERLAVAQLLGSSIGKQQRRLPKFVRTAAAALTTQTLH